MLIAGIIAAVIVILLGICVVRALTCPKTVGEPLTTDPKRAAAYAEKLSTMVRCETVSRRGSEDAEKFRAFHSVMAELFPNVFAKLEKMDLDGSLLMKWTGSGKSKPILLLAHMDVVPASAEGWKYPPFSGTIADGAVWGRGAMDTKCSLLGFFQAAEELLAEGFEPDCDIYLASSCTEEIGGSGAPKIVGWLKEHGVRLGMVLDEGGGVIDNAAGLPGTHSMIALGERGQADIRFIARSAGGHASTPPKNTPLVRLGRFMADCEKHNPFRRELSATVRATFETAAETCPFWMKLIFCNFWLFGPLFKVLLPMINSSGEALLQTTMAFTMASGSNGYNVIPREASVCANIRFSVHQNMEESLELLRKRAAKYDIEMELIQGNPASDVLDVNSSAYRQIADLTAKMFPEATVSPFFSTGATDARFFREVTEHTVRFAPSVLNSQQYGSMHAVDENIGVDSIPRTVDFFREVIRTVRI